MWGWSLNRELWLPKKAAHVSFPRAARNGAITDPLSVRFCRVGNQNSRPHNRYVTRKEFARKEDAGAKRQRKTTCVKFLATLVDRKLLSFSLLLFIWWRAWFTSSHGRNRRAERELYKYIMRFLTHPGGSIAIVEWPLKSSAPAFPRAFFITTVQAPADFRSVARRLTRPLDSSAHPVRFVWLRSGIRSTTTEFPFRDDPILSSRPRVFSPRLLKRFCRWFCLAALGRLSCE